MEAIMRVLRAFWLATISAFIAQPGAAALQAQPAQDAACHEFTISVMIAGQPREAVGQACQQPDGSWRIVQEPPPPAQPAPDAVYPPPYPEPLYPAPYYPSWDYPNWAGPYWAGPSFFVAGSFVFGDRFGRFRRFDRRFDHHDFFVDRFDQRFDHRAFFVDRFDHFRRFDQRFDHHGFVQHGFVHGGNVMHGRR
jgi:hypothetical protein